MGAEGEYVTYICYSKIQYFSFYVKRYIQNLVTTPEYGTFLLHLAVYQFAPYNNEIYRFFLSY